MRKRLFVRTVVILTTTCLAASFAASALAADDASVRKDLSQPLSRVSQSSGAGGRGEAIGALRGQQRLPPIHFG